MGISSSSDSTPYNRVAGLSTAFLIQEGLPCELLCVYVLLPL
jgi:hypothetical protein